MKKPREDSIRIATEAAEWQRALAQDSPQVRAEFADWIKASPRHLREFMFLEALDATSSKLDPERRIDIDQLRVAPEEKIVPLQTANALTMKPNGAAALNSMKRRAPWIIPAIAAGVVFLGLSLTWVFMPAAFGGWQHYSTAIGEQRTVELRDGSVLQLNTQSRVSIHFDKGSREIRLIDGEALFKVAHDAARPFRVLTDTAVIRAVGTQFNVRRQARNTMVAVLEGKVEVRPLAAGTSATAQPVMRDSQASKTENAALLNAGQALRIVGSGEMVPNTVADVSEVAAWRQRRLVFRETTLGNIADEFNRYNRSPQIIVQGAAARDRRYGGTFDADDPESLVEFVARKGNVDVERGADRIVIRAQ